MAARKRGATGLSGVLLIDKPAGLTSHDVVARVRRATGEGRVGHAGTLDPMATGLLVVLVGPATRLEPYLSAASKSYEATIRFGSATDTEDSQGEVVARAEVFERVADPEYARGVLRGFVGDSMQRPPVFSAIKQGGKTAHRAARAGSPLDLPKRAITVFEAELLGIEHDPVEWRVAFTVSKGTYIRSLARDIGIGTGGLAHLSALRRTASGSLEVGAAHALEDIEHAAHGSELETMWASPVSALGLPTLAVPEQLVADGRALAADLDSSASQGERLAVVREPDGALLGIYHRSGDRLVADVVFPFAVTGGTA